MARYKPKVVRVVLAYFGVNIATWLRRLRSGAGGNWRTVGRRGRPTHWDRANYVDQAEYMNVVSAAYWDDIARFDAWFEPAREAWTGKAREGIGTFIEVLRPAVARHEAAFSSLGGQRSVAVMPTA
ncbi:phenylacetaldoxime dehydratase family protein [Streptomyces sp. L7]